MIRDQVRLADQLDAERRQTKRQYLVSTFGKQAYVSNQDHRMRER